MHIGINGHVISVNINEMPDVICDRCGMPENDFPFFRGFTLSHSPILFLGHYDTWLFQSLVILELFRILEFFSG